MPTLAEGEARTIVVNPSGPPSNALSFSLPPGVTISLESVLAAIDATGAGDTTATLEIADSSGAVIARKAQGQVVTGGVVGSATWALRLGDEQAAQAAGEPWCTATAALGGTLAAGVSSVSYFGLNTNDPSAFALTGGFPARLQFNKTGVYTVVGNFQCNSPQGGPVPNPHTTYVQGGPGVFPATLTPQTVFQTTAIGTVLQTWGINWVFVVTIDAAHVGGTMNWNWQNGTGVQLNRAWAFVAVQRLAD